MTDRPAPLKRALRLTVGVAGLTAGLFVAGGVAAQSAFDRSANVGVLDRPHPEFDALGLRRGAFLIYPRVELGVERSDNVYAAETDAIDDVIYSVKPSVDVRSDWSRHSLTLGAGANLERYADLEDENSDQYRLEATGRLDIQRDANVSGVLSYRSATESRGVAGATSFTATPVEYATTRASLAGVKEFNRMRISALIDSVSLDYEDNTTFGGAPIDLDYRDNDSVSLSGRLDYAVSPATAIFGELASTSVSYDTVGLGGDRDSDGLRLLAGVNFEISNLATGEFAAGYITRAFDNAASEDVEQFAYRGAINYYPTQLVTIGVRGETSINDSGVATTPAFVANSVAFQVDYEMRRNIIVSGSLSHSREDYQVIDRVDDRTGAGVTATYLMNQNVGVSLFYSQTTQNSSGANRVVDFTERNLGLALVLQL